MNRSKHIVIIAPQGTSILDVSGPMEVFAKTADYLNMIYPGRASYKIHVISADDDLTIHTSTGLSIICEGNLASVNYQPDTVIVAGIPNAPENMVSDRVLSWLKVQAKKSRRLCSVCAGALILAEAGILNGKKATTHWRVCEKMARLYPLIQVESDPIYVKDGNIYTSAGISTGMDLSLALVEEDYGREVALFVARQLVLYLKRPGNQSQFSIALEAQKVDYKPIGNVIHWTLEHLQEHITVEILAEKASMSPRNFARVFLRETGISPARYIEKLRLENARRRLEETRLTLDEISAQCGIGSADTLRRLFLRHMKTTPSDYRRSFGTALA